MINQIDICLESTFNSEYKNPMDLIGVMSVGSHIVPSPIHTDIVLGCVTDIKFGLNESLHETIKRLLMSKVKESIEQKLLYLK